MTTTAWLNTADRFTPGAELYRSERCFAMWAYTISHGQLLFRSRQGQDWLRRDYDTTIDVLFKPAIAMKLQDRYEGLVVRCATGDEAAHVLADLPQVSLFPDV
ncbi:hypothetical protein AB0L82_42835 [Nocardia sp. NPDC052001]|uniref:hypothetical protein n=1 Tax=Nocardia sp. NPDC052001 TaxID=3154853 RepID=UPI0034465F10